MKEMVEIEVVLDDRYRDPKVTILTKENTKQVENIIYAIENASNSDYPQITADSDNRIEFISQRDIVRIYVDGRKVMLQTDDGLCSVRKPLVAVECELNADRFIRISQSEIVNLYKVKCFDCNMAGTIGVEFDCGGKTWVSRSRVRQIKELLKKNLEKRG